MLGTSMDLGWPVVPVSSSTSMDVDGAEEIVDGAAPMINPDVLFPLASDASLLGAVLDESEPSGAAPMDEDQGQPAPEALNRGMLLYQRFSGDIERALLRTDDFCYARALAVLVPPPELPGGFQSEGRQLWGHNRCSAP